MSSVTEDLYQLAEETLGCEILGLCVRQGDSIVAEFGRQEGCVHTIKIESKCAETSIYLAEKINPDDKKIDHLRKILNIFISRKSDEYRNIFCGAEILETITSRKTVDDVMRQLVDVLIKNGGFCRAGIMFLNEALLELRGVIFAGKDVENSNAFRNAKIRFETKNQLSDIMFYDRTEIVDPASSPDFTVLKDYFGGDVIVTGLGVGERPIGVLVAYKDNYTPGDLESLLLYGNICSLSIEFSRTVKQLELTTTDLQNLRKTAVNAENLVKMGRLSATVAHELKNPLVAIGGFAKRMEQTAVNPQTKNYIKIVQAEVVRLERIVGDILIYSRRIELDVKSFNLKTLVSEVISLVKSCLCFSVISVEINVPADVNVSADRDKFRQVIMNLISNSVQEMSEGGELRIDFSESERHVTLSVSDTGGGIPADKREKIFEPFYTLKKSGTGLGLPLCKKIMTAHGGDVVVGDCEKGAVFTLILPKRG